MPIKTRTVQKPRTTTIRFNEIRKSKMQHMEPVFEKEQRLVQGPGILKVRARLCRVTVLNIFHKRQAFFCSTLSHW